jgi:hypothetical protein
MSEFRFTPGPWYEIVNRGVDGIGAGEAPTEGAYFFGGERICEFTTINPRNEANARLIAAAPSLISALHEILNHYTALINSGDAGNWEPEREPQVIAARAAIQLATGEPYAP